MSFGKWNLSLDVLLLLLLVPAHAGDAIEFLLFVPLLLYIWLAMISPPKEERQSAAEEGGIRFWFLGRLLLLFIIVTAVAVLPTLGNVILRLNNPADATGYTDAYAAMHDGALQMEIALDYLQEGTNPYAADYSRTPLRFYGMTGADVPANPALTYFVYLPGYLLLSFPAFTVLDAANVFYDQRLIYLAFYLLLVLTLPALVRRPTSQFTLIAALGLNPLLTGPVLIGMNDVVVLALLALMGVTLTRRRLWLATILFALACTLKQSAWFLAPFYLLLLFSLLPSEQRKKRMAQHVAVMAALFLAVVLPFFLWNPPAFITDVISYPAGTAAITYPIRGSTIGELLVGAGLIESRFATFPFSVLQLIFGLPAMLLLLRFQWRDNGIARMFVAAGLFIFTLGFFSRFFQTNYIGFVLSLITLGMILYIDRNPAPGSD